LNTSIINTFFSGNLHINVGKVFYLRTEGTFQLPDLTSAPSAVNGCVAFTNADLQLKLYTGGAWRHILSSAGW